jgi:predicted RNA-binding Zn-ribbon protein involved in translation (DUF1610 family)
MSLIIDCPSCRRKLRVPDELVGQQVKCPTCNEIFVMIDESASEPAPSEAVPTVELDDPPPSPPNAPAKPAQPLEESSAPPTTGGPAAPEELMACPYCGEQIAQNAARCRSCGESLREEADDDRPWEREFRPYRGVRRDSEPHRATLILTLGILSIVLSVTVLVSFIGLTLGITAWIMGYRDMKKMRANQMDPQGFGSTQAGLICGIVGTALGSLCSLYCLAQVALWGFLTVGIRASRMRPAPAPSPAPVPKKAPAKPGPGAATPIRFHEYLPVVK